MRLCTRPNQIDRPSSLAEMNALQSHQFVSDDFSVFSDFFLDPEDFEVRDCIGSGGESVIYLAFEKETE